MDVCQRLGHLGQQADRPAGVEAAALDDAAQVVAVDQLHDDGDTVALDHQVVDRNEMWMAQLAYRRALAVKPGHHRRVERVLGMQHLDGHH